MAVPDSVPSPTDNTYVQNIANALEGFIEPSHSADAIGDNDAAFAPQQGESDFLTGEPSEEQQLSKFLGTNVPPEEKYLRIPGQGPGRTQRFLQIATCSNCGISLVKGNTFQAVKTGDYAATALAQSWEPPKVGKVARQTGPT